MKQKTEKNILIAFLLNLFFSIFEFIGGTFTGSVAIASDAIHDMGDALSIGISYFLEKLSKKKPDSQYTYGYVRYSVMGSFITTMILVVGSCLVIVNAILKIVNPVEIHYDGVLILAVIGVIVNFMAVYFTREDTSLNQKAVNLHMLEDVLGWIVVLVGALVMKFTHFYSLDPLLSIGVALFILWEALENFKKIVDLFLEKTPSGISVEALKKRILDVHGVLNVHHIHIWSMDGYHNYATMHVVRDEKATNVKEKVKEELKSFGISHTTIELEGSKEKCSEENCMVESPKIEKHHHKKGC